MVPGGDETGHSSSHLLDHRIGIYRISVATGLQVDIESAKSALNALKGTSRLPFELIPDDLSAVQLPAFVKSHHAVTDGHLFELARKNSLSFVTVDKGISGALYIG